MSMLSTSRCPPGLTLLYGRLRPMPQPASTLWAIKKWDTLNSGKYWPIFVIFFTAIYNNELRNRNLLKFSPHLKSVATLPCETWNIKCTIARHLIYNRARDTIALLRRETPDFISPEQWPPNSPDMNPVDYKIFAVMQERVYEKRAIDVDELCQRLLGVWQSIGQNVIDEAIDQWRARLTACVRAKGGYFEHLM